MQQATARQSQPTPPPPPPAPAREYLRTRRSVEREAEQLESVEQLAIASLTGRRTPWTLPPGILRTWDAPVSQKLLLAFLGWLLEGSVRPRWAKGGLLVVDSMTRTVIGSLEDRDFAQGCKLVPGDWANLLRCSGRQARRCVRVAEQLGLVEQIRNRAPARRERAELSAAYRPTAKLLEWLLTRRPPADLRLPETDKMSDPQKCTPAGGGFLSPEELPTAGQIAVAPEDRAPDAAATDVGDPPPELAVGTVECASASAPGGGERPAKPLRLVAAGLSASPAAPPAGKPPGDYIAPEQAAAWIRELATSIAKAPTPWLGYTPSEEPDELRRARLKQSAEAHIRQRWRVFWRSLGIGGGS